MRAMTLGCALAALVAGTACGRGGDAGSVAPLAQTTAAIPKTIGCVDAPSLKERATAERRRATDEKSDQAHIVLVTRANYFASLAVFAELSCRGSAPDAEAALARAVAAAQNAAGTNSFYEKVRLWGDAQSLVTEAIAVLVREGQTAAARE